MTAKIHDISTSKIAPPLFNHGIPEVRQVTGLKQKVIDLLRPWVGKPTEVLDQKVLDPYTTYNIYTNE